MPSETPPYNFSSFPFLSQVSEEHLGLKMSPSEFCKFSYVSFIASRSTFNSC